MSGRWLPVLLVFITVKFHIANGNDNTTEDTATTQDAFTPGPMAKDQRLEALAIELNERRSQSFNLSIYSVSSDYDGVPLSILEQVYFTSDYLMNVTSRPTFTTIEEIVRTLSIVIDVLDDPTVAMTTHEVLCTTQLVEDITTMIFLEMTASDFDDFGIFSTIMSSIIEICDALIDVKQHHNWDDIRTVYPGVSMVVGIVDTVSLTVANMLQVPGSIYSNVKNIEFSLQLDVWSNFSDSDWILQVNDGEGIAVPKPIIKTIEFEDDEVVALVAVFYRNVSQLMGKNVTKKSVSNEILTNSNYKPALLAFDVISATAVKVPDLSGTEIPVTYRLRHDTMDKANDTEILCVWWDFTQAEENGGLWSKDGCSWVEKSSNAESSQCYCNHTTNFGLLIQKHDIEVTDYAMINFSWAIPIAAGVTIIPIIPFIFLLLYLSTINSKRRLTQIMFLVNFVIANLLIACTKLGKFHLYACIGINFATHYFLVASFTWSMVVSLVLFTRLVHCIRREMKTWQCLLIGLVFPLLPVSGMGGYKYLEYGVWRWCWINYDSYILYAYVGPIGLTCLFSLICQLISLRALHAASKLPLFVREKEEVFRIRGTCFCFLVIQLVQIIFVGLLYYWYTSSYRDYLGWVLVILFALRGYVIVYAELKFNKELKIAWKLKKNPPKVLEDHHDIWADDIDQDNHEEEYKNGARRKFQRDDTKMSVDDIDEHDADSVYSSRPGTRNSIATVQGLDVKYVPQKTNYFAKLKQMQERSENDQLQPLNRDYRQADGESRGRNSAASQGRRSTEMVASKKPKPGRSSGKDDARLPSGSYVNRKKKSVSKLAENLPKSPAPKTPIMLHTPRLPGSPDDPEEFDLEVTSPNGRRTGDGASPLDTERKSPEGYSGEDDGYDNEGYDEEGEYYDYDDYEDGEYDEDYDGEYYEGEEYTDEYD
ncbi:uncharacterized protein [Apostichopus japonicus]